MFNKWRKYLWLLLPVVVGLALFIVAQLFLPSLSPVISTIDLGVAGFVLGVTIRNAGIVAFVFGFVITALVMLVRHWDTRHVSEARTMYADYIQSAEQKRRQFLRRLDHEIKNPLTGLRAALVNLQEAQAADERWQAGQNAGKAVERLTRLLTDLRKLADLDERPIERYAVSVPELLDDVVEAARSIPAYEGRNISLLIPKIPSPFPMITGDRDLLVLAVYNLVENALKFTSANDSVEVRALEDGRSVVIEVADSGVGIPSEDLSKIFEELYRGSNARSTEGSGLGLALVNRIAILHGGGVGVRSSQNEPRGTVITLRLPRR
ncbi:MAG: Adaptive-response sensory-kinase SasA [Anaerolineales bacterium]|nr:Adaptive-response sensory-kinase SasA [Anaerolineales bacterium]WKZ46243.1 MAG: HAMP domain-containing sensor histidine kinase [Anaerolineales bacterium]